MNSLRFLLSAALAVSLSACEGVAVEMGDAGSEQIDSGSTGGGSAVTGGGSAVTGGGSAETGGGSAVTGGGSAETGGGSAVTGGGSAETGGGSAVTGGGSAETGGGSAVTGGGSAETGGGSAVTGGGSAVTGGGSAVTGGGSAVTGGGSAVTGGGSAVTGGGTAVTGGGAATGGGTGADAGTQDGGIDAGWLTIDAGPSSTRQTARTIGSTDAGNGFYEYLPPGYPNAGPMPLLVFWHGIGENGAGTAGELTRVLANGPPKLIAANQWSNARPFIVLSPQHAGGGCPSDSEIRNFIAWATTHYSVDLKRVYLTGLSCGAIGSWNYVTNNLNTQIAAAVLICGDPGDPTQNWSAWGRNMCNLGRLPIWSFHGSADGTVLPGNNRQTMANLAQCPQPRADSTYTEYPGVGHDSWTRTYNLSAGHDIYTWLLLHPKP